MTDRSIAQDIAKGLAIVAVVYGHVYDGLRDPGLAHKEGFLEAVFYFVYLWHMPLFFLFAGRNARHSLSLTTAGEFALRRVRSIVPLYFFWSLLQEGIKTVAFLHGANVNHPVDAGRLLSIVYYPVDQFWFLYALLFYHLVYAFSKDRPRSAATIAGACFAISQILLPFISKDSFGSFLQLLLFDAPFYFIGALVSGNALKKIQTVSAGRLSVALFAVFSCSFAAGLFWNLPEHSLLLVPASLSCVGLVMLASKKLAVTGFARYPAFLGNNSLSVFVMHVIFAAAMRTALLKAGIHALWVHLLLGTAAGVGMPLIVRNFLQRFKIQELVF